jgi:rRNA maturation RNase YbeY
MLNRTYLDHETFTDIITFDQRDDPDSSKIESDIFISIERIQDNSEKLDVSFKHELLRVMIHGILHLVGYEDRTAEDKAIMRQKESMYLSLYL